MARYFLALGSNVGDREANLGLAVQELEARGVAVTRSASVYTTEPQGIREQPWFLNTALEVETSLGPEELMRVCLAIEQEAGRKRAQPNGPRTLDIDIVLAGDRIVATDRVTIPHPRYAVRRFVLEPLAEIAPGAVDPVRGASVRELLGTLSDDGIVRRSGPPLVSPLKKGLKSPDPVRPEG